MNRPERPQRPHHDGEPFDWVNSQIALPLGLCVALALITSAVLWGLILTAVWAIVSLIW